MEKEQLNKIYKYTLSDIMDERFGAYSKYIIQDRAIPDARDGLKPVQRRILYTMYQDHNTYDKPYKKSVNAIGSVLAKYHPHGDAPVYDALIRMSCWWKQNVIHIDMHGNNGSLDGDPPAAYRYTEARLTKLAEELLKDLDRDTVEMSLNFDDTKLEPTVLPAKYPNLIVNGASGISAGYATNIAPHNLGEVIDATIKRIDKPNCTLDDVMKYIKGPDFPTGAIIEGVDNIRTCYETGKGKFIVKSHTHFEEDKKTLALVIDDIPYEVNKANLVRKIDMIRLNKSIDGINEVRDETTNKDGIRIVIELRKEVNKDLILNYLYKNTEMQQNFNYNAVAIVNRAPKQLSLLAMLDAYIQHFKEVVIRRSKFDLAYAERRYHIVEGLVKVLSILDEVIATIRKSKNKSDAKNNLVEEYGFSLEQAEAIVMLQLYRLTNTDVVDLTTELSKLALTIKGLNRILEDETILKNVMKEELKRIKKEFNLVRKTEIRSEVIDISIDEKDLIIEEDVIVTITKDGYIKRSSIRSYTSSSEISLKETDYLLATYKCSTLDNILLFTDKGNYVIVSVNDLISLPYKDMGKHINTLIDIEDNKIIASKLVHEFNNEEIVLLSSKGLVKRCLLSDLEAKRTSKKMTCMSLDEDDNLVDVVNIKKDIIISTKNNLLLRYSTSEINLLKPKSKGIKAIKLDKDDEVSSFTTVDDETFLILAYNNGMLKRIKIDSIKVQKRANKGVHALLDKKNIIKNLKIMALNQKDEITIIGSQIHNLRVVDIVLKDFNASAKVYDKYIVDILKI